MTSAKFTSDKLESIHPGEILREEFLKEIDLSQTRLAIRIGVPPRPINQIVLGNRSITADTALRLSRFFGNSAESWLGLQMDYDLRLARQKIATRLDDEIRPYAEAS